MPSAATGETLAERAQRVLGLDLDTWLSDELKSDNSSAPTNRSEQISQAQRKHRQRTQSYIQALEDEVLRLRKVEIDSKREIATLQEELRSNDNGPQGGLQNTTPNATRNSEINGLSGQEPIAIDWEGFRQAPPGPACCITAAENTPPNLAWTLEIDDSSQSQPFPATWADVVTGRDTLGAEDNSQLATGVTEIHETSLSTQMGVAYILKLERPCWPHLKHGTPSSPAVREGDLDLPYNYGTNHLYNLSTRLVYDYESNPSQNENYIGSEDLNKLLRASERLQLANEFTPVQVWALVCKLNAIYPIDPALVAAMFEELSKYSYCNSFGAAICNETVKAALHHFLGWEHGLQ